MPYRKRYGKGERGRRAPAGAGRLAASLASVLVLAAAAGAQAPPPGERWLAFDTPHFEVVFHEGLEGVAHRAAERAERALARLRDQGFGSVPPLPIQLVVTDHADLSNGFAQVIPYPRIVVWARPPVDGLQTIPFDEWLELVLTHELVHVLHLEMTGRLGRLGRGVLGRAPLAWPLFPSFNLPLWAIEGVAVEGESLLTEGGRIHGARFEATVRAQAHEGRLERLDQAMGRSPVFPGGERQYVYGALFHHHLAERFGTEAVGDYFRRVATRLNPYRIDASARDVFGERLAELHREWEAEVTRDARERAAAVRVRSLADDPEALTRGARTAVHAAFDPETGTLAYVRADGRSEPALVVVEGRHERRLSPLHAVAPPTWTPGGELLIPQIAYVDRFRIRSDLWRIGPGGERRTLTRRLRVAAVDARRQDGLLVAVLDEPGTNRLVLLDPDGHEVGELAPPADGVHWAHPRWAPDGERIGVTRWSTGGYWAAVVLDRQGRELARLGEGRSPHSGIAWSPDGRHLLWSSERTGGGNVYAAEVRPEGGSGPTRQVTDVVTSASFPAVSPDGEWLVFSLLGGDGWDLARTPFRPDAWFEPLPAEPRFANDGVGRTADGFGASLPEEIRSEVRTWSPGRTLRPRYWLPVVRAPEEIRGVEVLPYTVGAFSSATDVVGRHGWAAALEAPAGGAGRRWEGFFGWTWAGLEDPSLGLEARQTWTTLGALPFGEGPAPADTLYAIARERSATVSATLARPGFRRTASLTGSLAGVREDRLLLEADGSGSARARLLRPRRDLAEGAVVLRLSNARAYPFSVSIQEGAQAAVRLRERRDVGVADTLRGVPGFDGGFRDAVVSARAFVPLPGGGFAPPVLALRGAGGWATGPGAGPGHFSVGGGGGGADAPGGFTWTTPAPTFGVRGFRSGTVGGDRAWAASADLRVPLAVLHRGWRAAPIHLDRLAAAAFVDAGGASFSRSEAGQATLASAGAELSLFHSLLFQPPVMVRAGVAFPLQGPGGASVYAGLGWAY